MKSKQKVEQISKLKEYHIVFFKSVGDKYSTGVNIFAESMIEALSSFNMDYDGIEPFSIVIKTNYELLRVCNVCTDEMV